MDMKIPLLLLLLISIISPSHSFDANSTELSFHNLVSSIVFPIKEELRWDYTVSFKIGNNPVQSFNLDIDTGSDLTWVQCDYEQRQGCTMPMNKLYKPHNNFVESRNPLCIAVQNKRKRDDSSPCEYQVAYVDSLETKGFLVKDSISSSDGTLRPTELAFGCTNKLKVTDKKRQIPEGILGLGYGKESILFQLKSQGLIQNVVGHCIGGKKREGGYLFFGDIPSSTPRISYTPMLSPLKNKKIEEGRYFAGQADLLYNGIHTPITGLNLMFDCGTTFSYLNSKDYKVLLDLINKELNSKETFTQTKKEGRICWTGKRFQSIDQVSKGYLKPIKLKFSTNVQFQLLVEHYIVLSRGGDICLVIEDSNVEGFGGTNVIGAIAMHNKVMVFDNERKLIGWAPENYCKLL